MSLAINGAAILKGIADLPSSFGMGEAQVNALAMSAISARLKDKLLTLPDLRSLHQVLGASDMKTALDQCAAKDITALTRRLDPRNPELRGSDEVWQRSRLVALVEGAAPAQLQPRATRPRATPQATSGSKTGIAMKSKALKANREVEGTPTPSSSPDTVRPGGGRRSTKVRS